MSDDRETNGERTPDERDDADPERPGPTEGDDGHGYEPPAEGDEEKIPLSALRERMEAGDGVDDDADPFAEVADGEPVSEAEAAELFEEVDVGDVDGEAVWEAVVEGDAEVAELLEGARMEPGVEPAVEPTDAPDEHVVDKREYCQRCPFFAAPPETACRNEGTEIVELVDDEQFRVRGCPKVGDGDEAMSGHVGEQ